MRWLRHKRATITLIIACCLSRRIEAIERSDYLFSLANTELLVSRNTYLNAEQTYLQNKYMVLLYQQLLNFYQGKEITIND